MFKKFAVVAVAVVALALTGCSGGTATENATIQDSDNVAPATVTFEDGTTVNCLYYSNVNKGGVDCQWEDLNPEFTYGPSSALTPVVEPWGSENNMKCVIFSGVKKGGISCNL